MKELKLKKQYKMTEEEKTESQRVENMFFDDDHKLLKGGTLKKKDKEAIDKLYFKYIAPMNNIDWSGDLLKSELDDLRKDSFCGKNTNKSYWVKSYMIGWIRNFGETLDNVGAFYSLTSREANRRMISYAYELITL